MKQDAEDVERLRGKYRYWKPNECRKFRKFDERHRGGSWILKPDERKKLLRDKGGSLDIETQVRCMQKVVERPEGKS